MWAHRLSCTRVVSLTSWSSNWSLSVGVEDVYIGLYCSWQCWPCMCNVVVIVKTQARTCSAFFNNNVCLSSGSSGSYQYSSNTFIYSLKNYYGYGYFKKDVNAHYYYAAYSNYDYGPTFGGGHDLYIADNARYNHNSYCYCYSYTSPYCDNNIWTGNQNFSPEEVEVYYEILV